MSGANICRKKVPGGFFSSEKLGFSDGSKSFFSFKALYSNYGTSAPFTQETIDTLDCKVGQVLRQASRD